MTSLRTVLIAILVISVLALGGAALATAQDDAPGEPANFYGEAVDEDGNDAPVGTTIVAVVDGEVEDDITVETAGEYGEEGAFGEKLVLDSNVGDTVGFHIDDPNGEEALESPRDLDAGTFELNLTFPAGTFEDEAAVESISVELDDDTITEGDETEVSVTETLDDGSTDDVTDVADLESDDINVATVDGESVIGEESGTATIQAEYAGTSDSVEITVEDEETDEDEDETSSDENGESGGGGGAPAPAPSPDPEPSDDLETIDDPDELDEVIDSPEDADPTSAEQAPLTVDEDTGQTEAVFRDESSVESITFGDDEVEGDVTVAEYDSESEETGPSPGSSVAVTQVTVPDADQVATIRTSISTDRVEEVDADPDELRMNRFVDGEWQGLETEVVDETDERVVLQAETPGFSWFSVSAVSQPEAEFDVMPVDPVAGDDVTFDGGESSNHHGEIESYEWTIDGEEFTGETVTTVLDNAGDYNVSLTIENDAGETATDEMTLTVTQSSDSETEPMSPSDADESIPGFGIVVTLVAVIAGVAVAIGKYNDD